MGFQLFAKSILDHLVSSLLGQERQNNLLIEFYGNPEINLIASAFHHIDPSSAIAYLDCFGNLGSQKERPELLWLKPDDLNQSLKMAHTLLSTPGLQVIIIDSLFWYTAKLSEFEKALSQLAQQASSHQKQIILINPDNGVRKWLQRSLQTFCSRQIEINERYLQ